MCAATREVSVSACLLPLFRSKWKCCLVRKLTFIHILLVFFLLEVVVFFISRFLLFYISVIILSINTTLFIYKNKSLTLKYLFCLLFFLKFFVFLWRPIEFCAHHWSSGLDLISFGWAQRWKKKNKYWVHTSLSF